MFIGRERELATLEKLYANGGFQMPVIYGRRRVGKTALISEFVKDKPTVFFTAVEADVRTNLRNLSMGIALITNPNEDPQGAPIFSSLSAAFEAVFRLARDRPIVLVIDEYPYLAATDKSVSSVLQSLIDANKASSHLFLILCGSSLSFMKEQVLGEKSPLFGRRTAQLEIKPFDFFDALRFFPRRSPVDVANIYGMVGGTPLYLEQFPQVGTLRDDLSETFLDTSSLLFEEPTNLLKQEVSKASLYNATIQAIAAGHTQANEIATACDMTTADLNYYLKSLVSLGLLERESPIVRPGRRPLYRLTDNLFHFWYRFIPTYRAMIERGMEQAVSKAIETKMPDYMGPVFESICRQWLWRRNAAGDLQVPFINLGRWWGNDPRARAEAEIDLVGVGEREVVLAGECKWRNDKTDADVARTLRGRLSLIETSGGAALFIFSKSGFSTACVNEAHKVPEIKLVSFDEMISCSAK